MRSDNNQPRVIFTGGGTLGHLFPGLCVLEEMKGRHPDMEYLFAGSNDGLEAEFLRRRGLPVCTLRAARWTRGAWFRPGFYTRVTSSLVAAMQLLRRFRPDVVLGLGGYASLPVALAASAAGVPLVLLEQNALPGKANRVLSRWATRVCCGWPGSERWLARSDRACVTGNPIRGAIVTAAPRRDAFGLDPRKKTLLVLGGSRGAVALNETMLAALPYLRRMADRVQVLHATGPLREDEVRRAYWRAGVSAVVEPFIEDMAAAYGAADLVFCRAGGGTLAEICATGKPAIIVPYPYAADRHQHANARVLVDAGGAVMIDQTELDGARLWSTIVDLLDDDASLRCMREGCLALARPCAAAAVVAEVFKLVGRGGRDGAAPGRESLARGESAWAW